MILFVDLEHFSAHDKPHGDLVLGWRTKLTYRLQDIAQQTCLLQHYTAVDKELIDSHEIEAVFLSGSSTDPDQYGDTLSDLYDVVRNQGVPIFGFCGGFQFMMDAYGSPIERIGPLGEDEEKEFPEYMPGWKTETGYHPVKVTGDHELVRGLGPDPVFRHFHGWEVPNLADGFANIASTAVTENQLAINETAKQIGTQFHPEYYTDTHPAGRTLIENFCRWSGILS